MRGFSGFVHVEVSPCRYSERKGLFYGSPIATGVCYWQPTKSILDLTNLANDLPMSTANAEKRSNGVSRRSWTPIDLAVFDSFLLSRGVTPFHDEKAHQSNERAKGTLSVRFQDDSSSNCIIEYEAPTTEWKEAIWYKVRKLANDMDFGLSFGFSDDFPPFN